MNKRKLNKMISLLKENKEALELTDNDIKRVDNILSNKKVIDFFNQEEIKMKLINF
jgi:hypothetical protein